MTDDSISILDFSKKLKDTFMQGMFFEEIWEKERLHITELLNDYEINTIFPQELFDELLTSGGIMQPHLDIVIDGRKVAAPLTLSPSPGTCVKYLLKQFDSGATVRIAHIEQHIPSLGEFCLYFEKFIGMPMRANLYMTPPFSQGFQAHFDLDDIFVFQLSGCKIWSLYENYNNQVVLPNVEQGFSAKLHTPIGIPNDVLLKKGDMLYLPRGFMHEARTEDRTSLHITFAAVGVSYADILTQLVKIAAQDCELYRHRYRDQKQSINHQVEEMQTLINNMLSKLNDNKSIKVNIELLQKSFESHRNPLMKGEIMSRIDNKV